MTVNSVPVNRTINDVTVTGAQCFDAIQTISVAGNGSYFAVHDGGNATLVAGQNILFYPGTVVASGGHLLGYIDPVSPHCPAAQPAPSIATGYDEKRLNQEQTFFSVFPNPTTGEFTLELNGYVPSEEISVVVFNMKGERVISTEISDEMSHKFSLSGKPSGLYLMRVSSDSRSGSSRIVKQ
jgi:hypothetical protein